jgi:hypothetical protein
MYPSGAAPAPGAWKGSSPTPGCNSCAQIARICAPRPVTTQASPAAQLYKAGRRAFALTFCLTLAVMLPIGITRS